MAEDRREQDQQRPVPDPDADREGGKVEPEAAGGARSGDSAPAPTRFAGPAAQEVPATSTAGTARGRLAAHAIRNEPPPSSSHPGPQPPSPGRWYRAAPPQATPWQPGSDQWRPGQWPPATRWQPGPWVAWPPAPAPVAWSPAHAPVAWPTQYPNPFVSSPATWPVGYVPWGYSNPPAVPPVLEPPSRFHPPTPPRTLFSLRGRVSPTLYSAGLALGLPGLLALLFLEVAPRTGWKLGLASAPAWILVETICTVAAIGLIASAIAQSRQRRADGWQDYSGPSPFLAVAALLALVTGLGLPLARLLTTAGVDTDSAMGTFLQLLVYLGAYLGLVHFLAVRQGALTWRDVVRPRRLAPDPDDWSSATPVTAFGGPVALPTAGGQSRARGPIGDILLALAMLLPVLFVSGIVNQALLAVLGLKTSELSSPVPTSSTGLDPWIVMLTVAVVVPVGEEVFFRGFATNAWGRSLGRNSAILRAALFFAFVHVLNVNSTDPGVALRMAAFNFGARVPVAIALTWLYFRRRSILASGTLHASYNGLIQLLSLVT